MFCSKYRIETKKTWRQKLNELWYLSVWCLEKPHEVSITSILKNVFNDYHKMRFFFTSFDLLSGCCYSKKGNLSMWCWWGKRFLSDLILSLGEVSNLSTFQCFIKQTFHKSFIKFLSCKRMENVSDNLHCPSRMLRGLCENILWFHSLTHPLDAIANNELKYLCKVFKFFFFFVSKEKCFNFKSFTQISSEPFFTDCLHKAKSLNPINKYRIILTKGPIFHLHSMYNNWQQTYSTLM